MYGLIETEGQEIEEKQEEVINDLPDPQNPQIQQFIKKYDLQDLSNEILESRLKLIHLQALNTEDMKQFDSLCEDWQLNTAQKIRFREAIESLPRLRRKSKMKITILGEGRVGKTCLLQVMCGNKFQERQTSTISSKL